MTPMHARGCGLAVTVLLALAVPARGQAPAGPPVPDGAELRPAEVQQLFDAYLVMQAQQTLDLDDTQYPPFLTRLRELQETRRRNLLARTQALQDLARLAAPRAAGAGKPDEAAISERLSALQEIESRNAAELRKAYRAVDELLTPLQQARFRLFEEQVERRKLELLLRARQTMRQQRRQQQQR
jgi:hypothetical protein